MKFKRRFTTAFSPIRCLNNPPMTLTTRCRRRRRRRRPLPLPICGTTTTRRSGLRTRTFIRFLLSKWKEEGKPRSR
jgi:hypothetical protein